MPRTKSIQSSLDIVCTRCRINRPIINFAKNHFDHLYKTYNICKTTARQTLFPEDINDIQRIRNRTGLILGEISDNVRNRLQHRL